MRKGGKYYWAMVEHCETPLEDLYEEPKEETRELPYFENHIKEKWQAIKVCEAWESILKTIEKASISAWIWAADVADVLELPEDKLLMICDSETAARAVATCKTVARIINETYGKPMTLLYGWRKKDGKVH